MPKGRELRDALERYGRRALDARLILLHPQSRRRSLLVASLLSGTDTPIFYYAMGASDIKLRDFTHNFTRALSAQHATFGRHLHLLRSSALEDPVSHQRQLLRIFVRELGELADGDFYLILDEFDQADDGDEVLRFLERLTRHLPARCKLIINGRKLPRLPWLSLMASGHALILRDGELVRGDVYPLRSTDDASLRVYALGAGFVYHEDRLVDNWEGHLPRLLLSATLDRPSVTREEICHMFWGGLSPELQVNVFHVTKSRLHKTLDANILQHEGGSYFVDQRQPIYVDVYDFVAALLAGRYGDPARRLENWQRAANLYRGPFLLGHDDAWILDRREAYQAAYIEALENIAALHEAGGRLELALSTLLQALDTDFSDEALHCRALDLYMRLGRRPEAVAHYRRARSKGAKMSPALMRLSRDILAG